MTRGPAGGSGRAAPGGPAAKGVYVGVSGFSYPAWRGNFYPKELRGDEFLAHYSRRLRSVEINSSFYASPSSSTVRSWASKTGEEFKFSFKAPRRITHVMKLKAGSAEAALALSETLEALGPRRGPILFQLAPYSKADLGLLEDFLGETSGIGDRVFEFRHDSWFNGSTYRLLEDGGASLCIAETEEMKPVLKATGPLAYFRLRMDSYDASAIDVWAKRMREVSSSSRFCYAYLRHDEDGENALLAERLSARISG